MTMPEQWRIEGSGGWWNILDEHGHAVAEAIEEEAHVRLIAAAPDLLQELRTSGCPAGGWNGMPGDLEGIATVQDCLNADACGCSAGAAVRKAEGK